MFFSNAQIISSLRPIMIIYLMFLSFVSISTGLLGHGLDAENIEFWKSPRGNIWGVPDTFLEGRVRVPPSGGRVRVPAVDDRDGKIRLVKRKDYSSQLKQM